MASSLNINAKVFVPVAEQSSHNRIETSNPMTGGSSTNQTGTPSRELIGTNQSQNAELKKPNPSSIGTPKPTHNGSSTNQTGTPSRELTGTNQSQNLEFKKPNPSGVGTPKPTRSLSSTYQTGTPFRGLTGTNQFQNPQLKKPNPSGFGTPKPIRSGSYTNRTRIPPRGLIGTNRTWINPEFTNFYSSIPIGYDIYSIPNLVGSYTNITGTPPRGLTGTNQMRSPKIRISKPSIPIGVAKKIYWDEEAEMDVAYISTLFPRMSDESIEAVYLSTGGKVDDAVEMLKELEKPFDIVDLLPDSLGIGDVSFTPSSSPEKPTKR